MQVFSYGRFSSGPQEKGTSRKRQDDAFQRWCRTHKVKPSQIKEQYFDEAVSGFHGDHLRDGGGLAQFLEQIDRGVVRPGDVLVIENLDRLSRLLPTDAQELILKIVKHGLATIAVADTDYEINKQRLDSGDGTLWRLIGEIERAHRESKRKSDNVRASWEYRRRGAENGVRTLHKAPAWLSWNSEKKEYEVIKEKGEAVAMIYDLASKGLGSKLIVQKLNEDGIRPIPPKSKAWTTVYVQKILKEITPRGAIQFQRIDRDPQTGKKVFVNVGEPVEDYYPRIVSDELWDDVRKGREERAFCATGAKLDEIPNLFKGRIVCEGCGSAMYIRQSQRKLASGEKRRYVVYKCKLADETKGRSCDRRSTYHLAEVERDVVDMILRDLSVEELSGKQDFSELRTHRARLSTLERRIKEKRLAADNLTEALSKVSGAAQEAIVAKIEISYREIEELNHERKEAERLVSRMSSFEADFVEARAVIAKALEESADEARLRLRHAISRVVRRVVLDTRKGSRSIIVEFNNGSRHASVVVHGKKKIAVNVQSEHEAIVVRALFAETVESESEISYISAREAAERSGLSVRQVCHLAAKGDIAGARRACDGRSWEIPANARLYRKTIAPP